MDGGAIVSSIDAYMQIPQAWLDRTSSTFVRWLLRTSYRQTALVGYPLLSEG
jgi:hypothetical protein